MKKQPITQVSHEEMELDRQQRDRATGLCSLLGVDLCQYCGSVYGRRIVWDDPEDLGNWDDPKDPRNWAFTWERCQECNPGDDDDV